MARIKFDPPPVGFADLFKEDTEIDSIDLEEAENPTRKVDPTEESFNSAKVIDGEEIGVGSPELIKDKAIDLIKRGEVSDVDVNKLNIVSVLSLHNLAPVVVFVSYKDDDDNFQKIGIPGFLEPIHNKFVLIDGTEPTNKLNDMVIDYVINREETINGR